jgi:hypothetical protein
MTRRQKGDGRAMNTRNRVMGDAFRNLRTRVTLLVLDESGMSTVEYAIGTIAAAAFGAILYTVVTGDSVVSALARIIGRALDTKV